VENWIFEENLRPFFEFSGWYAGYQFDDVDWDAVRHGVDGSDADADPAVWFSYPLEGQRALTIEVAQEPEAAVIRVRVVTDRETEIALEAAVALMQTYSAIRRVSRRES
jgi:hypothetical protein